MLIAINVSPSTKLIIQNDGHETPVYVLTSGKNFDRALEDAEQWMGAPLATRCADPGFAGKNDHGGWSPVCAERAYFDGFKPFDHIPPDRDPWIIGVEEQE